MAGPRGGRSAARRDHLAPESFGREVAMRRLGQVCFVPIERTRPGVLLIIGDPSQEKCRVLGRARARKSTSLRGEGPFADLGPTAESRRVRERHQIGEGRIGQDRVDTSAPASRSTAA